MAREEAPLVTGEPGTEKGSSRHPSLASRRHGSTGRTCVKKLSEATHAFLPHGGLIIVLKRGSLCGEQILKTMAMHI